MDHVLTSLDRLLLAMERDHRPSQSKVDFYLELQTQARLFMRQLQFDSKKQGLLQRLNICDERFYLCLQLDYKERRAIHAIALMHRRRP